MSLPDIAGHELQDLIGSGRCGAVYRASSRGKACAVKVFSSMAINRRELAATMNALDQLPHHRGVLPIEDFNFEKSPYFCAMPLVGGMVKDSHGRRHWQTPTLEAACATGLAPEQAWQYIYELADALAWLHKHRIGHGNLRPCNVLIEDDPEGSIRLTDIAQGWVGGIHHLELTDHFLHLCPEQAESADGFFAGRGPSWDVYSFGVLAFRLLTGDFPRGGKAWAEQVARAQTTVASGRSPDIDSGALLAAVKAQPKLHWPTEVASKWDDRRRSVIERALDLNPAARWADMREVVREFEVLESDYLLEEARDQTLLERRRQTRKVRLLQLTALILLAGLGGGALYTFATLRRAQTAEAILPGKDAAIKEAIDTRESKIADLTRQRDTANTAKKTADANLLHSQKAVDQFLTQLLQRPTNSQLDVEFSRTQLNEALAFCMAALPRLESDPALGVERLRAYGNIGQIHLTLRDNAQAATFLEKARDQAADLLKSAGATPEAFGFRQWFGRYSLMLSDIREHEGNDEASLALLKDATTSLQDGLAADPNNRLARNECARAWMEYGRRTQQIGDLAEAEKAMGRVPEVLDPKVVGGDLLPDEKFLLARAHFAKGIILRDAGRTQDALTTLIDAVQEMGQLVMGSSPRNQEQALLLAEAYTELAELVARSFGTKEAQEAHNQAIPILLELNRLLPEWNDVKYLLARNYGALSQFERDAGANTPAVKKKQDAMELLNEILAEEKDNARYAALSAKLRGEYAELMADLGKPSAGLPIVKQGVEIMEKLLARNPQGRMTPERKQWEVQMAQMYGILGHTSETLKQNQEAKSAFTKGQERWTRLAGVMPGDEVVQQGLAWTKERLAKLK